MGSNGILVIDKPSDWTSHDVVAKLRGILREKRIGHAGTLDPMATGVLPVFVGRATRAVEFASEREKEYIAGLRLGTITDTQDCPGSVLETRPVTVTAEEVQAALAGFRGDIMDGMKISRMNRKTISSRTQTKPEELPMVLAA